MDNKPTKILKRSKTGMEAEFHLIDEKGEIANKAAALIEKIKGAKENVQVTKEIGKNMIEFGCYPDVRTYNPVLDIIDSIQKACEVCNAEGIFLYPFSTYPGSFKPEMSKGDGYKIKKRIFGDEKVDISCRVTGFHHHYSLPKGVFDASTKMIRVMRKSKLKRSMVSSYNFEIAADPVLTLFAQSSPFYEGNYLAKDSRVIVYRGGKKLRYPSGMYSRLQQIGGLPSYQQTATDLTNSIERRWKRWRREVGRADKDADFNSLYPFVLDIGWGPVKINKHGTLEQRGMDINYMSIISAITVLLKFSLRKIQRDFVEVIPADLGVDESFKLEDDMLYIPPHSYVRNKLQKWSAYTGYDKKEMHTYAKRFLNLTKSLTPKRYSRIIRPVIEMVDNKKSMSDKIIKYAKYKGYLDEGSISQEDARSLALYYSEQFQKDLESTRSTLEKISLM